MLKTQRWKRYGRVVVCHNGPLTPEQFVWVAVLRSPRGVVLAAMTAATGRGLRWEVPLRPQLLVPAAGPLPHLTGVDVRRTRLLEAVDVHPTAQPPQLRLSRALLDQATLLRRPDDVRAVLCAGVQQRMVRAGDLREVTVRMGPLRHRALLLRTIDDIEGGAHSVRELAFGRLMATSGLPQPSRQVVRQRSGGRHYLDAVWWTTRCTSSSMGWDTWSSHSGTPTATGTMSSSSASSASDGCGSPASGSTSGRIASSIKSAVVCSLVDGTALGCLARACRVR